MKKLQKIKKFSQKKDLTLADEVIKHQRENSF